MKLNTLKKSLRINDLKESNRIKILELIRQGICSRVEISKVLGMSKPAVSSIVEELISEGLVLEKGHGPSTISGGKKPILLNFNFKAGTIIAVYFNERWYEIALTDLATNIISYAKKSTAIYKDYKRTLDDLIHDIQDLINQRHNNNLPPILACGIAIKGLVNPQQGTLKYSAALPDWSDVDIGKYLTNRLQVPVFIENDARAITYGETLIGNNTNCHSLICVTMSHGIGTGVVIQDEIYRGSQNGAVTFAHTTLVDNGPLCSCGNYGCWEALASVSAFLKELCKKNSKYQENNLIEIIQQFHDGDPFVSDVLLNYTGYWLGVGIANILNVFNPEKLIIQGDITLAGERLKNKIEEVAKKRALPVTRNVNISFSKFTEKVEIKGSSAMVIKHLFSKEYHQKIWKPGTFAQL
ncbi:ROK family transcriptional regulator [Fodinisporobacter ferrooxydans]|uniref:ROK family transcriptional regulator n=1 Tax=Fodinisporobacter ferrooxydans TaxID=2901836 RepID=A0ABY4CLR0_9BACL|nr:ROK family transcriptional regulator [Alicyclobacillaceae bacterium MYW30-H2]